MLNRTTAASSAAAVRRRPLTAVAVACSTSQGSSPSVRAIMVLRMLGSAAAVFGHGGSSRALVCGSSRTSAASRCILTATTVGGDATRMGFVRAPLSSGTRHRRSGGSCSDTSARCHTAVTLAAGERASTTVTVARTLNQGPQCQRRIEGRGPRTSRNRLMSTVGDGYDGNNAGENADFNGYRQDSRSASAADSEKGFWDDDGEPTQDFVTASPPSYPSASVAPEDVAGLLLEEEDQGEWMAGQDVDPDAEAIFYGDKVPFSDLGLSPSLCGHLEAPDLAHSTSVQAAAVPGILSGEDIIIGAETGSGKTLAYLLPIVERLLRGQAIARDLPDELLGNARGWPMFPDVIVLVPNKELCEQVLKVLKGILRALEADGNTDVTAAAMHGSAYEYPYSPDRPAPSILVCTPSFLHKYTNMKAIPLFCKATTLVMDEADMLMEGSYKRQLDDILTAFRRADRVRVEDQSAAEDGQEGVALRGIDKTQYVLAAATLPTYGLKSVDQYITRAFPDARKVQQVHMHKHHPAIRQEFVEVGGQVFDKIRAVIQLLQETDVETTRTMIFTNTAASCKRACEALTEEGFSVVPYHKEIVPLERLANLQALRAGRANILVCTDLAARGIDVPSVTHIVQMEMATNVVQHLHRLGRAARAGRTGKATNFFDDSTKDLVNSIKDAGEGSSLDGSFSRQRGFRKKFKKYGPSRTFQGETPPMKRSSSGRGMRETRRDREFSSAAGSGEENGRDWDGA